MKNFLDDCKNNPCAMGSVCHDLINDFGKFKINQFYINNSVILECECPRGFSGKFNRSFKSIWFLQKS